MGARDAGGPDHVLEAPDGIKPASMYLYEASVTGTETALLAAAMAPGVTEIRHAATEPHVVELCEFLSKMGAGLTGVGSATIQIEGVPQLHGAVPFSDRKLGSRSYFDLVAAYTMSDVSMFSNVTGRLGINNVLDKDPPLSSAVGTTGNGNTYPQTYDALGRWIFLRGQIGF